MGRFQEERRAGVRRRMLLWGAVIFMLGLAFVLGKAVVRMHRAEELARERFENESAETAELAARERELREDLAALGETRGLEEELRRKFRVAKKDEQLVVILDEGTNTTAPLERNERQTVFGWLRDIVRGVTRERYTRD